MFKNTEFAFKSKSDIDLKRAYYLYKLIGNTFLTRVGTSFFNLSFATNIPFVKYLIKKTIYKQFVGGEDVSEAINVASNMYKYGVSSILDYSIEGLKTESQFDDVTNVMLNLIDVSKNNNFIPFVVFKPTAIGKINIFEKYNNINNESDRISWNKIVERFEAICKKGYDNNVNIMIDAEETWMQDAADILSDNMMRKYNTERPIIWNTLQMYRHDRLNYLKLVYEKSLKEKYFLGFKIVRGAYMEKERKRAHDLKYVSPIQPNKQSSDNDYNKAIDFILSKKNIGLFAGTHNEESCSKMIELMNKYEIKKDDKNYWFGQLYGMSDNISFNLGNMGYNVAKYLPYGPIKEVMPYLIRRAQENTSVSGQTGRELNLIIKELSRRKTI